MEYENDKRKDKKEINKILSSRVVKSKNKDISILSICVNIVVVTIGFIVSCILIENLFDKDSFNKMIWIFISFVSSIAILILAIYSEKLKADKKYKDSVMPDIIENLMGDCFYDVDKFIDKELYYESGLFKKEEYTNYSGSNYIEYEKDKITTVTSNLRVTFIVGKQAIIQFSGEYFINILDKYDEKRKLTIKYRKKISAEKQSIPLILIAVIFSLCFGVIGLTIGVCIIGYLTLRKYISLADSDNLRKFGNTYGEEFGNLFIVQGNYAMADKILTKDLIDILLNLKKYKGVETSISIKNNIAYVAFDLKRDLFKLKLFQENNDIYVKDYQLIKEIRKVNDFIADKVLKALE